MNYHLYFRYLFSWYSSTLCKSIHWWGGMLIISNWYIKQCTHISFGLSFLLCTTRFNIFKWRQWRNLSFHGSLRGVVEWLGDHFRFHPIDTRETWDPIESLFVARLWACRIGLAKYDIYFLCGLRVIIQWTGYNNKVLTATEVVGGFPKK